MNLAPISPSQKRISPTSDLHPVEEKSALSSSIKKIRCLGSSLSQNHAIVMNVLFIADKIFLAISIYNGSGGQTGKIGNVVSMIRDATFDLYAIHDATKTVLFWTPYNKEKRTPFIEKLTTACNSLTGTVGTLKILHNRKIIDLSILAVSIGNRCPILIIFLSENLSHILKVAGTTGQLLSVGNTAYTTIALGVQLYQLTDRNEIDELNRKFNDTLFDLLSGGTSLAVSLIPMIVTVNPLTLVTFAIIAKGTGLCVKLRKKMRVAPHPMLDLNKRPESIETKVKKRLKPSEIKRLKYSTNNTTIKRTKRIATNDLI